MARLGKSPLFPLSPLQSAAFLALGVFAAAAWNQGYSQPAAPPQAELVITDARTCAAVSAYTTPDNDTGLQAAFATVALNKAASPTPPDCGPNLVLVMADDFDAARWQRALDLVDSIRAGDSPLSHDACARANEVIPPTTSTSPSDAPARAQCVISGYAFVELAR